MKWLIRHLLPLLVRKQTWPTQSNSSTVRKYIYFNHIHFYIVNSAIIQLIQMNTFGTTLEVLMKGHLSLPDLAVVVCPKKVRNHWLSVWMCSWGQRSILLSMTSVSKCSNGIRKCRLFKVGWMWSAVHCSLIALYNCQHQY